MRGQYLGGMAKTVCANICSGVWVPDNGATGQCIALEQELLAPCKSLKDMQLFTCFSSVTMTTVYLVKGGRSLAKPVLLGGTE